jgi:hypothetical protein
LRKSQVQFFYIFEYLQFFKDTDPVEHGEASMTVSGKKAPLLVSFIFNFLVPPSASGKSTQSGADGGIFLSRYQEPYQHAFHILIPKGWKAEGGMVPSGVQWKLFPARRR